MVLRSLHISLLQSTQAGRLEKKFRDPLGQPQCRDPVAVYMLSFRAESSQKFQRRGWGCQAMRMPSLDVRGFLILVAFL